MQTTSHRKSRQKTAHIPANHHVIVFLQRVDSDRGRQSGVPQLCRLDGCAGAQDAGHVRADRHHALQEPHVRQSGGHDSAQGRREVQRRGGGACAQVNATHLLKVR